MARLIAHATACIEEVNVAFFSGSLLAGGLRLATIAMVKAARTLRAQRIVLEATR